VRTGVVISNQNINVRSGPGTNNSSVASLIPGTTVEILDESEDGEWYHVRLPASPSHRRPVPAPWLPSAARWRDDNDAIWSRLVILAGGDGARFVVFGTASGNPERSAARVVALLESHGAEAESLPVAPKLPGVDVAQAVRDPELIARVNAARGVFFTGGAQERIVDALQPGGQPTPLLKAIRGVLDRGGVVAGTSAGAAVMSHVMFRDAPDLLAVMKGTLRDGKEVDRGLASRHPACSWTSTSCAAAASAACCR